MADHTQEQIRSGCIAGTGTDSATYIHGVFSTVHAPNVIQRNRTLDAHLLWISNNSVRSSLIGRNFA